MLELAARWVRNARLFSRRTERAERMRRLAELGRLASSTLDLQEVRAFVVRATAELLRCDLVRLWELDEAAGHLALGAQATAPGLTPPTGAPARLPLDTLMGHVATTGKRRYSPELAEDPLWRNPAWVRENRFRSQLAVPLLAAGRALGTLAVVYRRPYVFDADEILLLESFAAQAATAIRNAALYAELALAKDRLEKALEENRALLSAAQHQALHDALTALPNRVLLYDRLSQTLIAAHRERSRCALMLMDLDRFKQVNDTFGHQTGDELLQQAAERLTSQLRASDTLARLGGDEFAVLLAGTDAGGAAIAARKLVASIAEPFQVRGHRLEVGLSVGIALYPEDGTDADTLLRRADIAMYMAKRGGTGVALVAEGDRPAT